MNIDQQLINILDKTIKDKYKPNKHKVYYSNEYYLTNILEMLNDINKWNTLKKMNIHQPVIINGKIAKNHYKTIENKYRKWCNDGIFETAFQSIINERMIKKSAKLMIDSTFINNKYGVEDIGLNTDNKKKRSTKISIITDKQKFIYSVLSIKLKNNTSIGFIHDVNTIQDSLNKINKKYEFYDVTILGDKGYISRKDFILDNKKIKLLTCKKKNQLIQNTENEKKELKDRLYVENSISNIKKNNRVMTRTDHNIKTYMGFVFIACLKINMKIVKNY